MGAWDRSWSLTRTSFEVMRQDSEMIGFPILAGIFSVLFSAALLVPTFALGVLQSAGVSDDVVGPVQVAVLFVTYFGLAFIATFFNVCVVYTTRTRLEGGDATFFQSIGFAFSRIHLIAGWSLVSATVGLILHAIERAGRRAGLVGKILLSLLRAILASAWSIMTIFVVPSMVYRGLGPFAAIKDSAQTLRQTWGENLIQYYGLGFVAFVAMLPAFLLGVISIFLFQVSPILGGVLLAGAILWLIVASVVFNMLTTIFRTALYHYATTRVVPRGFDPQVLQGAFGMGAS